MNPTAIEIIGTVLFGIAVCHTFLVKKFEELAHKYPQGSVGENFYHFLGEVEVVFGLWAAVFVGFFSIINGFAIYDDSHHLVGGALHYLESLNFTEPAFVFVIMCMSGTRPIILFAEKLIVLFAKVIPCPPRMAFFISFKDCSSKEIIFAKLFSLSGKVMDGGVTRGQSNFGKY